MASLFAQVETQDQSQRGLKARQAAWFSIQVHDNIRNARTGHDEIMFNFVQVEDFENRKPVPVSYFINRKKEKHNLGKRTEPLYSLQEAGID